MSEYAEALTNPIKHISQLHKRETQLAVLLEDSSEVGGRTRGGAESAPFATQPCKCLSSTSTPTSPKTESPGKRAKWCREAPPPCTSSRSTRWTTPPTSSSYRHQVDPLCCLGNQEPPCHALEAGIIVSKSQFSTSFEVGSDGCDSRMTALFWTRSKQILFHRAHVTHAVFVLPVCVCSTKPEKRPHSHRFGR